MTFKAAAMSRRAVEEEDNSVMYYSDEEDDLDAFSDAELGCEDGGRTRGEGHTPEGGLCVPGTPFMAAAHACCSPTVSTTAEGTSGNLIFDPIFTLFHVKPRSSQKPIQVGFIHFILLSMATPLTHKTGRTLSITSV